MLYSHTMEKRENLLKWVEVSSSAIRHNLQEFRRIVLPDTNIMAVVKSNAYGHGILEVAQIAVDSGADWLGVNELDEALQLRNAGHLLPILVLGAIPPGRMQEAARDGLRAVIYTPEQVAAWNDAARAVSKEVPLHIKLETGLNRQGVPFDELLQLARTIKQCQWVRLEGMSTHFANIEDTTDHSYANRQIARFEEGLAILEKEGCRPPVAHCACSAAALVVPKTSFDMVRVGIGMYGLWPSKETQLSVYINKEIKQVSLKPALTWKTRIAQVKTVAKGSPIGYGCTERATHELKLAILPVGYYDGLDRGLSNQGQVIINGQRAYVRGRVCMNMTMVDVTHIDGVKALDEVILLGGQGTESISAEFIGSQLNTINYEVVTRIGAHLPRIVVD